MIVDSSILIALALAEPSSAWIRTTLASVAAEPLRMSWVNVAEVAIMFNRAKSNASIVLAPMLEEEGIEILSIDHDVVRVMADARVRLPINFGDCFAYAHARILDEPLLTLDADFLKTDLRRVLHPDA